MYVLLRNTHLIMGLISIPFLLIYAVSSLFFAHSQLNPYRLHTTEAMVQLPINLSDSAQISRALTSGYGLRGELVDSSRDQNNQLHLTIVRPGKRYDVVVDESTGIARLAESTVNFAGFFGELHVTAGVADGQFPERIWGWLVLGLAICIVFITATGFLLWLRRAPERKTGAIFLLVSLTYCMTILVVIRGE